MIYRLPALVFTLVIAVMGSVTSARADPLLADHYGTTIVVTISGVPKGEQARINGVYPVSNQGNLRLWKIGNIKVTGLAPAALATTIEAAYRDAKIYANPKIHINGIARDGPGQKHVTVGGKVRFPGLAALKPETTLQQAITEAGGPTDPADVKQVKLYRNGKVWTYDLTKKKHQEVTLLPGDVIDLPPKKS